MSFAVDRDLLALEPNLFRDIAWAGQRLIDVSDADLNGTSLTSPTADFEAAQIDAGHVALVNGTSLEVVARVSPTELTVSLLRDDPQTDPLPPASASDVDLIITTFRPQIRHVHDQLLRALGIEPTDEDAQVTENDIANAQALVRVEALGALHLIFAAAAAMVSDDARLWTKAKVHRERFIAERARVAAAIDLNGDGLPDATRRLNTIQFIRI